MLVKDLMSVDPLVLSVDETIVVAELLMNMAHIRHLPVVKGGRVVGLVTHRDLLGACSALLSRPSSDLEDRKYEMAVAEVMQVDVRTIDADVDMRDAIEVMIDHKYGCLPVTDQGRLVGILTEADFLKFAKRELDQRDARKRTHGEV